MKALIIGGTGFTGPYIVDGLLERGYQVTVLNRGVHQDDLPPDVERIRTDPHWLEPLKEALEGRTFDVVVSTYGRLRPLRAIPNAWSQLEEKRYLRDG